MMMIIIITPAHKLHPHIMSVDIDSIRKDDDHHHTVLYLQLIRPRKTRYPSPNQLQRRRDWPWDLDRAIRKSIANMNQSMNPLIHQWIYELINPSIHPSIHLSIDRSIHSSINLLSHTLSTTLFSTAITHFHYHCNHIISPQTEYLIEKVLHTPADVLQHTGRLPEDTHRPDEATSQLDQVRPQLQLGL